MNLPIEEVGPYWVLTGDSNLTPTARRTGTIEHELAVYDAYGRAGLKAGDVALDVGAYIGETTINLQKRGCVVYAFEPQPDAFMCLAHNCTGAYLFNGAVGDGRPVRLGNSTLDGAGNLATRTVEDTPIGPCTMRLDDMPVSHVEFIKIDTEGTEPIVLEGARELIRRCKPHMYIEVFPRMMAAHGWPADAIYKILEELRYKYDFPAGNDADPNAKWDIFCSPK